MRTRTLLIAVALGICVAWLALSAFGLLVVSHPFGREAERTVWLSPLLQVLSWFPIVGLGTFLAIRFFDEQSLQSGLVAALSAVVAVIASFHYTLGGHILDTVLLAWLHLLCPMVFFPAFVWLLANESFKRTPQSGVA
jgi:hypothetical protein